ncbi:hypothetical protein [Kitasatospora griseola]|uniref:hypothetical protein n=1 Tax=Kitasatospora griseola TaxID=2064 RepID=UPI000697ED77|nr:hypothetical protein [Kitasatospora griseola]
MAFVQPLQSNPRPGGRGLPAIGFLLLVQVAIELAVLGYDLSHSGLHYLPIALGVPVDAQYWVPAPVSFTGYDTALVLTLLVLAFGAVNGRRWARPGAVAVLAVNGYCSATALITAFVNYGEGLLHQGTAWTLLTASLVVDIVIALVVVLLAAAGREQSAPALSPYPPPYAPAPSAPASYAPAPAAPAPAPGAWGAPGQPAAPTGYWPPQPPAGTPGAGYGFPPPPPAPPVQPPAQPPVPPSV